MKYVVDTNIVARILDGDARVLGHLAHVEPSDVLLVAAPLPESSLDRLVRDSVGTAGHVRDF